MSDDSFFIGWSGRLPRALRTVMLGAVTASVLGLGALGLTLSAMGGDPDEGMARIGERAVDGAALRPEEWLGAQTFRGRLERRGYSLLHVQPDAAYPQGRVLLLSGWGKRAPEIAPAVTQVELTGGMLRRGSVEMLVVEGEPKTLDPATAPAELPRVKLGRWRVVGEICDGKCYPGGMRPGAGFAHRACANLCLFGEVPPLLVTTQPVAGSSFLILATPGEASPYTHLAEFVAGLVEIEGEVERVGNVLLLHVDVNRMRRL